MTLSSEIHCYYEELGISKQQKLHINKHNFGVLFGKLQELGGYIGIRSFCPKVCAALHNPFVFVYKSKAIIGLSVMKTTN